MTKYDKTNLKINHDDLDQLNIGEIKILFEDCGQWIKHLEFTGYGTNSHIYTPTLLELISKFCSKNETFRLETLTLFNFTDLKKDRKLLKLLPLLKHTKSLSFHEFNNLTTCPRTILCYCRNLKEIMFERCFWSGYEINSFMVFPPYPHPTTDIHVRLKKIFIKNNCAIRSSNIIKILHQITPNLEELTFLKNIGEEDLNHATINFHALRNLTVLRFDFQKKDATTLLQNMALNNINLKELIIHRAKMTSSDYSHLGRLRSLELIGFSDMIVPVNGVINFYPNVEIWKKSTSTIRIYIQLI